MNEPTLSETPVPTERERHVELLVDLLVNQNWIPTINDYEERNRIAVRGMAGYLYDRGVRAPVAGQK